MRGLIKTSPKKSPDGGVRNTWPDALLEKTEFWNQWFTNTGLAWKEGAGLLTARGKLGPGPLRHEHRTPADITGAGVPIDFNHASLIPSVGVNIGAAVTAGGAMAQDGASPSPLQAENPSSFVSTTESSTAVIFDTASPLSFGAFTASPVREAMTVTTDRADYAPGSTATIVVDGVNSGNSVAFQVADLAGDPGINGIADVYAPFSVTDGGPGDADGLANGAVVTQWQVPSDGSATGATLQLTATSGSQTAITTFSDAPNKIVSENLNAGTAKSVWAIHGSIANQGDSQIEGFATQISTNAGQTVSFKIDTASSGYTLDIYRLGYYGGNGARLVTTMHHSGAD